MANVWILHGHDEAPCGCSVTYSIYTEPNKYTDGRDRMDAHMCEEHND